MLDSLPSHIRNILFSYDFIVKYLEGKMSKEKFLEMLNLFKKDLMQSEAREYLRYLANADAESEFHRKAAHSRFVRFARKLGLDIATPQDKVNWIKSVNSEKFLDVLSVSAGLLSGIFRFLRWKRADKEHIEVRGIGGRILDLDPPQNSYKEFEKFFNFMQRNISVRNMPVWAVKLYFTIICAHMFPDGNGRIARNAYFFMMSNGLIDEEKSSKRVREIGEAMHILLQSVVLELLRKEGFNIKNYSQADEYRAHEDDTYFFVGYTMHLKYIAAKRVLQKRKLWKGEKSIVLGEWRKDMLKEFEQEYQKVRIGWFWMCIKIAEKYYKYFQNLLDRAILNK